MFVGLVRGFGLNRGAIACSSAWDTSDIIVVGEDDEDMAMAVNRIYALQGGVVVCVKGEIIEEIPLPIFGLLADMGMEALAKKIKKITKIIKDLGYPLDDPVKTLTVLTGAAIPFLRICEEGLVDIKDGTNPDLVIAD